jgi:hypothetical protein
MSKTTGFGGADVIGKMVTEISEMWVDYLNTKETEKTKRTAITARKEMVIEDIRARRDILMRSIDKAYEERFLVISKFLEVMENGIQNDNIDLVSMTIGALTDTVKHQPGSNTGELVELMNRGSYTLDLT